MAKDVALDLYLAHRRKLVFYANGIIGDPERAEDVVQEAYLRFRNATAARLPEEPVGYLYRIVRNIAVDRLRRRTLEDRHTVRAPEHLTTVIADDTPSPEDAAIARQELQRVIAAMEELPERTRIALEMHRFGGCTLKEIARHLNISISMAQVLVMDGIRHCQRAL